MKRTIFIFLIISLFTGFKTNAQQTIEATGDNADTAVFEPATEQGKGLDLAAVLAVFQESQGLEDFEKKLNEKDGVNNLDLNGDSIVDYIRVLEKEDGDYRVVVLQAIIGENDFQDVAYINIKRSSEEDIQVQAEGSKVIYGEDYYVAPDPKVNININLWAVWGYMYTPDYHYYHSPYYWGYYPHYWHHYHPRPWHYYHSHYHHYHHGYHYGHHSYYSRPPSIHAPRNSSNINVTPSRPTGSRPPKPGTSANTQPTGKPSGKPATKPGAPSSTRPAGKPSTKPSTPATRPATKPATKPGAPATRPSTPATRPSTKPATRPSTKPATRPSTKPAKRPATPATRPSTKPATRPSPRPSTRPATPPRPRPSARPATPSRSAPARMPAKMPARR